MRVEISDFSLQGAFERFCEEIEEIDPTNWPLDLETMVDLHDYKDIDVEEVASKLEGSGLIFGYIKAPFGDNANKTQSGVDHRVHNGTKSWGSAYMAVWDTVNSTNVVEGSRYETKGDCVTAARKATEETGRRTYVLVGKYPIGFSRALSEVTYKPSPKQALGNYVFVW